MLRAAVVAGILLLEGARGAEPQPSREEAAVIEATDSYKAALKNADEAMKKFDSNIAGIETIDKEHPDPRVGANNITDAIASRFADATEEAEKTFKARLSDLESANMSTLHQKVDAALAATDEVKHIGERKAHKAHALTSKMRDECKDDVRKEGGVVKKLALKAKKAAREIEKAKKHAWGEKGEMEAENEFLRNEKVTEGMEHDAEHKREHAEDSIEKFSKRAEHYVEKWADSVTRDAKHKSENMRRSVHEAQAKVVAKAEAAKQAEEKAEAAKETEEKAEVANKTAEKDDTKQDSAPKDASKPAAEDASPTAAQLDDAAVPSTKSDQDDDQKTAAVEGTNAPAASTDVKEVAPINDASAPGASPASVFLAQLVFVVVGASVAGLIPNLRRHGSFREPAILG